MRGPEAKRVQLESEIARADRVHVYATRPHELRLQAAHILTCRACSNVGPSQMDDFESQPVDGLVIMALRIRDEDRRKHVIHRLVNNPGECVTSTIFEFSTADWDEGLWDEELTWFSDVLEGTRDSIIVWRFVGSTFTRFTIGEGA